MWIYNIEREEPMPVLLIEGKSGTGKDLLADEVMKRNPRIRKYSTGRVLQDISVNKHPTNSELYRLGLWLQNIAGASVLEREALREAQEDYDNEKIDAALIVGTRRIEAHNDLVKNFNAFSLFINAPRRFRREWKWNRNRDSNDRLSQSEFIAEDREQAGELLEIEDNASEVIYNFGSKEELLESGIIVLRRQFPFLL